MRQTISHVVYCCYGGAHTSITCAALHCGLLPRDRLPRISELLELPGFDRMESAQLGSLRYTGSTAHHRIFAAGLGPRRRPALRALYGMLGAGGAEFCFVDALVVLHPLTFIGGAGSRRLGLTALRSVAAAGIRASYGELVALVGCVEEYLEGKRGWI